MKKWIYIPALLYLIGLSSCEGFLDVEPVAQISINEQLSTSNGMLQALNGAYLTTKDMVSSIYFV